MAPNVEIMSRNDARAYAHTVHKKTSIIVSISSIWEDDNDLPVDYKKNGVKDVLHLKFNDTEYGLANHITRNDATQIVRFVESWKNRVDTVIVHCHAGISRSSGVGAAILEYLTGDAAIIFESPDYSPNITCYRYVLNAFNYLKYFNNQKKSLLPKYARYE